MTIVLRYVYIKHYLKNFAPAQISLNILAVNLTNNSKSKNYDNDDVNHHPHLALLLRDNIERSMNEC